MCLFRILSETPQCTPLQQLLRPAPTSHPSFTDESPINTDDSPTVTDDKSSIDRLVLFCIEKAGNTLQGRGDERPRLGERLYSRLFWTLLTKNEFAHIIGFSIELAFPLLVNVGNSRSRAFRRSVPDNFGPTRKQTGLLTHRYLKP